MSATIRSAMTMEAVVKAALDYGGVVTDRDPDDGEHVAPGELRRFLARLRLLHGVPFSYLVPDAKLLPVESVRFFYLDRAWTDALVQGALSVGTISSADRTQLEAIYPHIRAEVDEAERTVRQPRGEALLKGVGGTVTGFLLRSRAVSGWPNLHVRAYAQDVLADNALTTAAESHPSRMKLLRMERLAPAVLLVLIDGVPAVVHIEEPRQGIQFGVRFDADDPPDQRRAKVHMRDNTNGAPMTPETDMTPQNSVFVPFRPGAPGVVNVTALADRLAQHSLHSGGAMPPNSLALQMLRFPYRQVFGDPDDTAGLRFAGLDKFVPKVAMADWQVQVATNLGLAPT